MNTLEHMQYLTPEVPEQVEPEKPDPEAGKVSFQPFEELERCVRSALETYSNVHRGTGHNSMISSALFERARDIVMEYLGLDKKKYLVVFYSVYGSELFKKQLQFKNYHMVSSRDIGLPLGLRALAIRKSDLPKGIPFQTGGSVAKMVSPGFVIWSDAPQKFEAGTPAVINAIAFAIGLILRHHHGDDCFRPQESAMLPVKEILHQDELSGYSGSQLI